MALTNEAHPLLALILCPHALNSLCFPSSLKLFQGVFFASALTSKQDPACTHLHLAKLLFPPVQAE